jgi:hypothetical protein
MKAIYFISLPVGATLVHDSVPVFVKGRGLSTNKAHYSAADVKAIETEDGKIVTRIDPPASWSYLLAPAFTILGFLLPWGAIKMLTWIGMGFFQSGKL